MKYNKQTALFKLLAILSAYCMLLLAFRIWMTGTVFYGFLVWNLFLAYIPFAIGSIIIFKMPKKPVALLLLFIWLLFLPNAPYIITDIFHLKQQKLMPEWFDLLLVISFAINGLLLFFLSVRDVYTILLKHFSSTKTTIITLCIFFLTGFGVYLGRFLRFNSWDMLTNPKQLLFEIAEHIFQPVLHPRAWGFTLGFGTLLLVSFFIFKTINFKEERIQ